MAAACQAKVTIRHARGPLTTSEGVELIGTPFAGYNVSLDSPTSISTTFETFTVAIVYRDSGAMPVSASNVAFALATVPATPVVFPTGALTTDRDGKATIVVTRPTQQTAVYITPPGGDSIFRTDRSP